MPQARASMLVATAITNIVFVENEELELSSLSENASLTIFAPIRNSNPKAIQWSNGTIFRTADVPVVPERDTTGVADYVKSLVKVYSNMNNVYIVNENDVQIKDVQVYDIYGKLIYAGKNNGSREIISMDVATGNYIVRLFTDKGIANYKLYLSK